MKVEQFVMANGVEQDRLRAILPKGFVSLRPVLRINAEVRDNTAGYVEFNTAVEKTETEVGLTSDTGMMCRLKKRERK